MTVATGGIVAEPEPVVLAFLDHRRFGSPLDVLAMSPRDAEDLRDVADIVAAGERRRGAEKAALDALEGALGGRR